MPRPGNALLVQPRCTSRRLAGPSASPRRRDASTTTPPMIHSRDGLSMCALALRSRVRLDDVSKTEQKKRAPDATAS